MEYNLSCGKNARLVGEPIDVVTGANTERALDFELPGPIQLRWWRYYHSARNTVLCPLGWGHSHHFDRSLQLDIEGLRYTDPFGNVIGFPDLEVGAEAVQGSFILHRLSPALYELDELDQPTMQFKFGDAQSVTRLFRLVQSGTAIEFRYAVTGCLQEIVDARGQLIRVSADREGRIGSLVQVVAQKQSEDRTLMTYQYDSDGNLILAQDVHKFKLRFEYDLHRRMTRKTDRRGYSFHFDYDDEGRCVESRGEDGLHEVHLDYQPALNLTVVRRADGGQWSYFYDDGGNLTRIVDPYSGATTFTMDEEGRVVEEVAPNGEITKVLYDEQGQLPSQVESPDCEDLSFIIGPLPSKPPSYNLPETALEWEFGELVDPVLVRRPTADDPLLRLFPPPVFNTVLNYTNAYVETQRESKDFQGLPDAIHKEHRRRDPNGNVVEHTDRDGSVYRFEVTSWNLLHKKIDPLGHATTYDYSPQELITRVTDAGGTVVEYGYDLMDRMVEVRYQGRQEKRFRYDAGEKVVAVEDGQGRTLATWSYGSGNLEVIRSLASGELHTFQNHDRGRVLSVTTSEGTVTGEYDKAGHRIKDLRDDLGVEHDFQPVRLEATTYFGTFLTTYEKEHVYDRLITDPTGAVHRVKFSQNGLIARVLANGTQELCQYGPYGRCLRKASVRGRDKKLWMRSYSYSGVGDLKAVADTKHGSTHYNYDAAHRLAEEFLPNGSFRRFTFDAADNLIEQPGLEDVVVGLGNRLERANGEQFIYNEHNHLSARENRAAATRYEYDELGQLVRCYINGQVWSARYDGLFRRTNKTWQSQTTTFYWDGFRLAAEVRHDGSTRLYIYIDEVALVPFMFVEYASLEDDPTSGRRFYLFTNHIGVPIQVEDDEGKVVWSATIDPFGNARVRQGSTIELNLRFPGHYYDPETGLHYNRFRYYSPELGRYLQIDPAGTQRGVNLYAYCRNPLRNVDIDGLGPCPYDLTDPDNQALLKKPLEEMTPEELKKYTVLRAKELQQQHVGDNKFADQGITTAVTIVRGPDGQLRSIVTVSSEARTTPNGMELKPGEQFVAGEPHLVQRTEKDENGQPIMTPVTDKKGNAILDENGEAADWKESKQTVDKKTGEPYDKDSVSRHHAEQRAKNHVNKQNEGKSDGQKDEIKAIGPSKPCCAGCRKALGNDLDKVDGPMQGTD